MPPLCMPPLWALLAGAGLDCMPPWLDIAPELGMPPWLDIAPELGIAPWAGPFGATPASLAL